MIRIISNKYVILGIRLLLGFVFIYASIHKIAHPADFAQDIYNYRMMPHWTINFMALVMPWLELFCGVLIVAGPLFRGSAIYRPTSRARPVITPSTSRSSAAIIGSGPIWAAIRTALSMSSSARNSDNRSVFTSRRIRAPPLIFRFKN